MPPLTPFSRPRGLRPFVDVNRSLRSRMFDTKESLTASERSERAGQGGPEGADAVLLAELLPASEHDGTGGPAGNRANRRRSERAQQKVGVHTRYLTQFVEMGYESKGEESFKTVDLWIDQYRRTTPCHSAVLIHIPLGYTR